MSRISAVKIDLAVTLVVPVIHGHSVRIAVVTVDGKNAAFFCFENMDAFFGGQFLVFSD